MNEEHGTEKHVEGSDEPNISGTSLLNPDPSFGCLPIGLLRRLKPRSYATPLEDPGTKAWNYLLRLNIIELFEIATAEIFHRRIPDPVDFLIEAAVKAKVNWQEKVLASAKIRHAEEEAARLADAILRAAGDDVSPQGNADEVDDDLPGDSYSSVVTPSSSVSVGRRVSCFPETDAAGIDFLGLERHLNSAAESGDRPGTICGRRDITYEEALRLLSYLL